MRMHKPDEIVELRQARCAWVAMSHRLDRREARERQVVSQRLHTDIGVEDNVQF